MRRWTREGRLDRRTVVVGADERGNELIRALAAQKDSDIRVVGVFDDRGDERSAPSRTAASEARHCGRSGGVRPPDTRRSGALSLPIAAEGRILQMLKKLWVLPVDIRLAAHSNKLRFRPRAYSYLGGVPVIDIVDKPITDWDVVMKWLFDRIVGSLMLIARSRRSCC